MPQPKPKVCYYGGRAMRCLGNGVTWQNAELPQAAPQVKRARPPTAATGTTQELVQSAQDLWNANPDGQGPADAIGQVGILPFVLLLYVLWKMMKAWGDTWGEILSRKPRQDKGSGPGSFPIRGGG